jgi:hypothetical protein
MAILCSCTWTLGPTPEPELTPPAMAPGEPDFSEHAGQAGSGYRAGFEVGQSSTHSADTRHAAGEATSGSAHHEITEARRRLRAKTQARHEP